MRTIHLLRSLLLLPAIISMSDLQAFAQVSDPPTRPLRQRDEREWYRPPTTMRGKTVLIPIGTTWEGRLDQTISSEHSHPGTKFSIVLSAPVLINGADVVIPSGSQVIGEVVEAISASSVPKIPGKPKLLVHGKLRIQIVGLRTPDGMSYPLVANLVGEQEGKFRHNRGTPLGTGVAYMGTTGSFEAARPGHGDRPGEIKVMSKRELLRDPLLGLGDDGNQYDENTIRSLVLKKRDYYIYSGSPLTVKLSAPFKIGVAPPDMSGSVGTVNDTPEDTLPPPTRTKSGPVEGTAPGGSPYGGRSGGSSGSGGSAGGSGTPADSF